MTVVRLHQHRDRETAPMLANLAGLAEHEGGSAVIIYRRPDGEERVGLTGIYKADPAKALMAAMQLTIALTSEEELGRAP